MEVNRGILWILIIKLSVCPSPSIKSWKQRKISQLHFENYESSKVEP